MDGRQNESKTKGVSCKHRLFFLAAPLLLTSSAAAKACVFAGDRCVVVAVTKDCKLTNWELPVW